MRSRLTRSGGSSPSPRAALCTALNRRCSVAWWRQMMARTPYSTTDSRSGSRSSPATSTTRWSRPRSRRRSSAVVDSSIG
ncbi:hypothetical protein AB9128_11935 [Streptomyces cinereoruber]|uniref:hypothetical protein n=1 Tax=Streptomyces cinereoruber TaxID=67260 RepID=UPI003EB9685D